MGERPMAIRSSLFLFHLKISTFFRWKEILFRFITPIICIMCYLSRKKYIKP